jgi:hypothetical protein
MYHTGSEVGICTTRTTDRTLLAKGNLVLTRSVHAAEGSVGQHSPDSRMSDIFNDTLHVLIPGDSFTTSRISSFNPGVVDLVRLLLITQGAKFKCSQRLQWVLNVCFSIWTSSPWTPFLVQTISNHSITVRHCIYEMCIILLMNWVHRLNSSQLPHT